MKWLQAATATAIAGLAGYLGAVGVPVAVLAGAMALDYASGVARAFLTGELSSRVGARGIVKKLCYMLVVGAGMGADYLVHSGLAGTGLTVAAGTPLFGLTVTAWLIVNELISIVENAHAIGLPVPQILVKALEKARTSRGDQG